MRIFNNIDNTIKELSKIRKDIIKSDVICVSAKDIVSTDVVNLLDNNLSDAIKVDKGATNKARAVTKRNSNDDYYKTMVMLSHSEQLLNVVKENMKKHKATGVTASVYVTIEMGTGKEYIELCISITGKIEKAGEKVSGISEITLRVENEEDNTLEKIKGYIEYIDGKLTEDVTKDTTIVSGNNKVRVGGSSIGMTSMGFGLPWGSALSVDTSGSMGNINMSNALILDVGKSTVDIIKVSKKKK